MVARIVTTDIGHLMPTIEKSMEQRIADMESLVFDLPHLLNLRVGKFDAQFAELGGRMTALENMLTMLGRDVRDMRGGVTAQLRGQDERLRGQDGRLSQIESRLSGVVTQLTAIDSKLDRVIETLGRR